jgi:hypothetical protein
MLLDLGRRVPDRPSGVADHSLARVASTVSPLDGSAAGPTPPEKSPCDERATIMSANAKMNEIRDAGKALRPPAPVDRVTVALIPKAANDLQSLHDRTGLSKTDLVNRAISLYEFVDAELATGSELIIRRDGTDHILKLL